VELVSRKIFHAPFHFIGRDSLVQFINSWLQNGSHGVAIALLYGIGGVGKTAIAKRVLTITLINFKERAFYQILDPRM